MEPISIEALRDMVRGAPPGSFLMLSPDVFDKYGPELLTEAAKAPGGELSIRRTPTLAPGTVAVMAGVHVQLPKSQSIGESYLTKYAQSWVKPAKSVEPTVMNVEAVSPTTPKVPKPPTMPKPPAPPRPMKPKPPRQRVIDT